MVVPVCIMLFQQKREKKDGLVVRGWLEMLFDYLNNDETGLVSLYQLMTCRSRRPAQLNRPIKEEGRRNCAAWRLLRCVCHAMPSMVCVVCISIELLVVVSGWMNGRGEFDGNKKHKRRFILVARLLFATMLHILYDVHIYLLFLSF